MFKIYVINLEKRIEKKQYMNDQLKEIPHHFYKAVDGSELDFGELKKKGYNVSSTWTSPTHYHQKHISPGEVGCYLSHYGIYQECLENKTEIAVIFEDDVIIPENFNTQLDSILEDLKGLDWEFCFLSRCPRANDGMWRDSFNRPLNIIEDIPINDKFVFPAFSYWMCAYIINKKGMDKMINFNPNKYIIPMDEILPLFGLISPYKYWENYYNIDFNNPLKIVSLKNLIANPKQDAFSFSDTDGGQQSVFTEGFLHNIHLLATGTEMVPGLQQFIDSCEKNDLKYTIMGLNQPWHGGNMSEGPGGGQKINFLINQIKDMHDEQVVLVTDSYDVVMNTHNIDIANKFYKFSKKIIFASETSCWPDESLKSRYPKINIQNKFLNSGGFIGRVKDIKKILPMEDYVISHSDDQLYYTYQYLAKPYLIELDYNCEIFQCLNSIGNDFDIINLNQRNYFYNKLTDTIPAQIHGNGGDSIKSILDGIYNQIYKIEYKTDAIEIKTKNWSYYPSIIVFIDDFEPCQSDLLEDILKLNYLPERIQFYYIGTEDKTNNITNKNNYQVNYLNRDDWLLYINELTIDFDFVFYVDQHAGIKYEDILYNLMLYMDHMKINIIAPLLVRENCIYSNFWGDLDDNNYYKRSDNYIDIVENNLRGIFDVPYISTCILMVKDLFTNEYMTHNLDKGDGNDMAFCYNLRDNNHKMYIINIHKFGNYIE